MLRLIALIWLAALGAAPAWGQPAGIEQLARRAGPVREILRMHPEAQARVLRAESGERWEVVYFVEQQPVAIAEFDRDGRLVEARLTPEVELSIRPQLPLRWAALVALLIAIALFGPRADVILLFALVPFLDMANSWLQHLGLWLVTLCFFVRSVMVALQAPRARSTGDPRVPTLAIGGALCLALIYHGYVISIGVSEDSGVWGCYGAQYLARTGEWPYGQLHFADGKTYGPLFYLLLVPLVGLFPPGYEGDMGWVPLQEWIPPTFERLDFVASKCLVGICDLAIVLGLVAAGRLLRRDRAEAWRLGFGLALIYAVMPYSVIELIHPSRSVPTAFILGALLAASRPLVAGGLLGMATATMHFPALLIPLWCARYRGRRRWQFLGVLALVGLLCLGAIHHGQSDWAKFWDATWNNLEGPEFYGSSPYGFWGTNPQLAWAKLPLRVLHLLGCIGLIGLRRPPSLHQLAAWTAAVLTGVQLWKTHGGGHYISWHLPFLLIALLARQDAVGDDVS